MESNNNYVTRDFYDSNMREFKESVREMIAAANARTDKAVAEMKAETALIRADFAKLLADVQGNQQRLDNMDRRIDNIEKSLDRFFRNAGFALTGMTLFFTAIQVLLTFIK